MQRILLLFAITAFSAVCLAQTAWLPSEVEAIYPDARALSINLHEHPELSGHEMQTASTIAGKLRDLGYQVTEHVGGTGLVALLKNGAGPTIMLRTELDALPVEEKTGLSYASKVHAKNDAGEEVPVMHACGHDIHMASLYGTAAIMIRTRQTWQGTLMLVAQPAEETIGGSKQMLQDGLFTRFPRPDAAVALHVVNVVAAGTVGVTPGIQDANSDSIRITIFGKGGDANRIRVCVLNPGSHPYCASGNHIDDMQRDRCIRSRKTREQSILKHLFRAADGFLSRLSNQHKRALPCLPRAYHDRGRTVEGRHMNVVTAGVHHRNFFTGVILGVDLAGVR